MYIYYRSLFLMKNSIILGSICAVLFLLFLGCIGYSGSSSCTGKMSTTINGETQVCVNEKMTSTCSTEGELYSETSKKKIVCTEGKWVPQESSSSEDTENDPFSGSCTGKQSKTVKGVSKVCVNGTWTDICSVEEEGEKYYPASSFVCTNGKWVDTEE